MFSLPHGKPEPLPLARPPVEEVIAFIDANKDMRTDGLRWGIEPICAVLQVAPSTYWSPKRRPPSARSISDAKLAVAIRRVHEQNYGVYGVEKVWQALRREGLAVGRDQVARIMRQEGLRGITRGRRAPITTVSGQVDGRPDLVKRDFTAPAPNRVWVADVTYVRTWSGWVYVAFVIDVYSRMIVGWQSSMSLRSDLALDALEMALWARRGLDLSGLVYHSDRACNISAFVTPNASPRPASNPRSVQKTTPTTVSMMVVPSGAV